MSRYSSNLARSLFFGSSVRNPRNPASTEPSTFMPPRVYCAVAGRGPMTAKAIARRTPAACASFILRLLTREELPAGMVRAVDVGVAVRARASHHASQGADLAATARERAMRAQHVTLLAEPRLGHLEHLLVVGPVRFVAVRAAFLDRRVCPEVRPAL